MESYKEMLKGAIASSRLSLSEISDRVKSLGVRTTREYLSRLQNGKLPPATDKLNDAIARVLKINPSELKAAAYKEKIPPDVLDILVLNETYTEKVSESPTDLTVKSIQELYKVTQDLEDEYKDILTYEILYKNGQVDVVKQEVTKENHKNLEKKNELIKTVMNDDSTGYITLIERESLYTIRLSDVSRVKVY
jgi:transcriptional regulator with XRE-family HTH domain